MEIFKIVEEGGIYIRGWKSYSMQMKIKRKLEQQYLDKIDFKIWIVKRDKEGYYIMIKESIQEDRTIVKIYTLNIGAPQYI